MSIERQLAGLLRATTELSVELRIERDRLKVINQKLQADSEPQGIVMLDDESPERETLFDISCAFALAIVCVVLVVGIFIGRHLTTTF